MRSSVRRSQHFVRDDLINCPSVQAFGSFGEPVGMLDFLDIEGGDLSRFGTDAGFLELLEKWWCLGDVRNRATVWVQGHNVLESL